MTLYVVWSKTMFPGLLGIFGTQEKARDAVVENVEPEFREDYKILETSLNACIPCDTLY